MTQPQDPPSPHGPPLVGPPPPYGGPPPPPPIYYPPPGVPDPRQQSWVPAYGMPPQPPPTYMALSIISLVVSLLLAGLLAAWAGIIAIVQAGKVQNRWHAGDYEGAFKASRGARTWAIAGFVLGGVLFVVVVVALMSTDAFETY